MLMAKDGTLKQVNMDEVINFFKERKINPTTEASRKKTDWNLIYSAAAFCFFAGFVVACFVIAIVNGG